MSIGWMCKEEGTKESEHITISCSRRITGRRLCEYAWGLPTGNWVGGWSYFEREKALLLYSRRIIRLTGK